MAVCTIYMCAWVCMCVSECACVCVVCESMYTYTYIYIYMCIWYMHLNAWLRMCMCVHVCACLYICAFVQHLCIYVHVCVYVCMHIWTTIIAYIYVSIVFVFISEEVRKSNLLSSPDPSLQSTASSTLSGAIEMIIVDPLHQIWNHVEFPCLLCCCRNTINNENKKHTYTIKQKY